MKSESVLSCSELSKSFRQGDQEIMVLDQVELEVQTSETVAVVGVSGSGKSTLLHLLAGLDQPDSGEIVLAGYELGRMTNTELGRVRNQHLGFVYQFHHLLPEFSAIENVALPLIIGGMNKKAALFSAEQLMAQVGLSHRLSHHPNALSGGERQRVAIARALVTTPDVVLADEPTGNLDEQSAAQVHDLMLSLASELGIAFVVVTHNLKFAEHMQTRCELHGGKLERTR